MSAVHALEATLAVAVKLSVLHLLDQPASPPELEVGGDEGDGGGVDHHVQPALGEGPKGAFRHWFGGATEGVNGYHLPNLYISPVSDVAEALRVNLQPVPRLGLLQELPEIDVTADEDPPVDPGKQVVGGECHSEPG